MTDTPGFDAVYISVGSPQQKQICEALLPELKEKYDMPFFVSADSTDGARIGSGGAVLQTLAGFSSPQDFRERKILIILTGGNSKRAANYTLRGKAFISVGANPDTGPITCMELLLQNALRFSTGMDDGVLVCCGDIIVDVSGGIRLCENTAVCVNAPISVGVRHGVMFPDASGALCDYLQKPDADTLGAFALKYNTGDMVPVDAGLLYFTSDFASGLYLIAAEALSLAGGGELNLFTDILPVGAKNVTKQQFLRAGNTALRALVWNRLRGCRFQVTCLSQPFRHFGTAAEILRNAYALAGDAVRLLINSDIGENTSVGAGSLLDTVRLTGNCRIGERCLITDIVLDGVDVPSGTAVFGVCLEDGRFVTCVEPIQSDLSLAAKSAAEWWELPQFYPDISFTASYLRFLHGEENCEKISPAQCSRNADPRFWLDLRRYVTDARRAGRGNETAYAAAGKRVLDAYFSEKRPLERLCCRKERVDVRLPVRINFSGTWTDCMPYCIERGGEVVNAAVRVNGALPISITAERIEQRRIEMCSADAAARVGSYMADDDVPSYSDFNLHRAVFQVLGIGPQTAVADGIRLTVSVNGIMRGSGLGTSSIVLFGCFAAMRDLLGLSMTESDILYAVFIAEQLMHTGGGWQDQGSIPDRGIKSVSSAPGIPQRITVTPLPCSEAFLQALSQRLVLISTGQRHFGRFIVTDVMNRYIARDPDVLAAFARLAALNGDLREAVRRENLTDFARCLRLHGEYLDFLSPMIYNKKIKNLAENCLQFADGCSVCGAGGGGYLAALCKEGVTSGLLAEALHTQVLPVEII